MSANRVWPYGASAGMLLWPAIWNGFPIVFADTGTYLSQAIHRYIGWDRPPFYSLFMLPLHGTVTLWPVCGWRMTCNFGSASAARYAARAAVRLCPPASKKLS